MNKFGASTVLGLLLIYPQLVHAGATADQDEERETLAGGPWHPGKYVACTIGIVTSVHPRLEEASNVRFESGVAVEMRLPSVPRFFNGQPFRDAAVVHYGGDRGNTLMESERPGDKVQVCLASFPTPSHDPQTGKAICDPNEDPRGMVFRIYDYKHRAAYIGPDSEHSCGGA